MTIRACQRIKGLVYIQTFCQRRRMLPHFHGRDWISPRLARLAKGQGILLYRRFLISYTGPTHPLITPSELTTSATINCNK